MDRTCPSAQINSAFLLKRRGRLDEATHRFRKIVAQVPTRNDARSALADCLFEQHAYAEARVVLREQLRQEPGSLRAHSRLIQILHRLAMWPEYQEEIDRRQRIESSCTSLDFERGYRSLMFGDLPAGWKGYESRFLVGNVTIQKREFQQPRWTGEPFAGKTLLLYHEQGFGDTLMFLRYAPMVKALGGRVLVEVQPALADLAATCQGMDRSFPMGSRSRPSISSCRCFPCLSSSRPAWIPFPPRFPISTSRNRCPGAI